MNFKKWFYKFLSRVFTTVKFITYTSLSARENNVIKLGVIAPLSGDETLYGQSIENGIVLAVENYNHQGGILGKEIKIIVYDSHGDAEDAIDAFEKLVNIDKVDAVIGGVITPTALAIAPLSAKYNLPMITPTATSTNITKGYNSVFRSLFTTLYQGKGLAQFAYDKLIARKASILYDKTNKYSIELAEAFRNAFEARGGVVVSYEGYEKGTKNFSSLINNVKKRDTDVLFIPDYYTPSALIVKQVKQAGINADFLGGNGWQGWKHVDGGDEIFEGTYFTDAYAVDEPTQQNKNFVAAYRRKFNQIPNSSSALGYDTTVIMLEAIKRAGSTNSDRVIEWLEATNFEGVTGEMRFDREHNIIKPMYMFKIQGGKNILIQKLRPDLKLKRGLTTISKYCNI